MPLTAAIEIFGIVSRSRPTSWPSCSPRGTLGRVEAAHVLDVGAGAEGALALARDDNRVNSVVDGGVAQPVTQLGQRGRVERR